MSIQAVAWVLEHSQSRGHARLVLISLANHHNGQTGQCNPGQRAIAQEAGVSPGSIPPQIRILVDLGEVEILEPGGPRRTARYRLPFMSAQEVSIERSGDERSARPKTERSAYPRAEQNQKRTGKEPAEAPPTPPMAREWAEKWCDLTSTPKTRAVLRKFIPQVQDYINGGGHPTAALLDSAWRQGIETPAGWGFVKVADSDAVRRAEDWMKSG